MAIMNPHHLFEEHYAFNESSPFSCRILSLMNPQHLFVEHMHLMIPHYVLVEHYAFNESSPFVEHFLLFSIFICWSHS